MVKNKKTTKGEKNVEAVEEALSKSERFIETNQNLILGIVAVIVLIVAGYIGYTRFVMEPREQNARAEIFMAEKYFEQDSLELALYGDGANYGFLDIIDNYRFTKTANLARYYAGISYLRLGDYERTIEYLKSFKPRDQILGSMSKGVTGDAYLELGEEQKALEYYTKAFNYEPDKLTAPVFLLKAAKLNEKTENYSEALNLYKKIQEDYPDSQEARNIEKHIGKMEVKANK